MLDDYFSATSYDTLPINATLGATNNPSLGAASMDGGVFNQAPGTHMIAPSPFSDGDR